MSWLGDFIQKLLVKGFKVTINRSWPGERGMGEPDTENHDIEHQRIEDVIDLTKVRDKK